MLTCQQIEQNHIVCLQEFLRGATVHTVQTPALKDHR